MDAELREAFGDEFDVWPEKHQRYNFHPWHDCQRIAAEFESEQDIARDFLLPQHKALGAERDDPGALAMYEKHRIVERQIADKLYCDVTAYAQSVQREILAGQIKTTAIKMFQCRTAGNFGMGPKGRPVIAWESKCGCSKLCPDEARHEGQRLFDRYAEVMAEHEKRGGRVYKMWLTLPNYPGGRLAEGQRYIFKRFRDRMIRPVSKGKNKFGIDGALAILEAPLSKDREWNVHLNVVLLTKGWVSYAKLRDAWGWNLEVRHHRRFDEKGMHALFNEMVKYSVRTVTEKAGSKHHSEAPAFIDWTPAEILEWFAANRNFRRTRAYGCLHGIGKPDRPENRPARWLGALTWHPDGYRITWRGHNLAHTANELLRARHCDLDLIRGDRSTAQRQVKTATGPP